MNSLTYFCNPVLQLDGNGEVNNVAATVKLGQADKAEGAEGKRRE